MSVRSVIARLLALVLAVAVGVAGCTNSAVGLSGDYREDTLKVVDALERAIDTPDSDPQKEALQERARQQIDEYIALYRRDEDVSGLRSFTTMRTALNTLAGHYSGKTQRPVPDEVKERLKRKFAQVRSALQRNS